MAYQWTKELETGNPTIDRQHKQLIEAINNLLDACAKGKGRDSLAPTAKFLQDYTTKHFADEERLQRESGYPDYVNHRRYHEEFKKVVADIVGQLKKEGPTIVLVGKVNRSIGGWLLNHIKRQDVKVAAHIRSKQNA